MNKTIQTIIDHVEQRLNLLVEYTNGLTHDDPNRKTKELCAAAGVVELRFILVAMKQSLVSEYEK
jgi:hypothetical protein